MQLNLKSDPDNVTLKVTYLRYRNFCNKLIKKLKRKYESQQIKNNMKDPKALWKTIKECTNLSSHKSSNNDLLEFSNSPNESVNNVNNYFANIGKHLAMDILKKPTFTTNCNVLTSIGSPLSSSFFLAETDDHEVDVTLQNLKTDSAPGWDGIQVKFLKMIRPAVVPVLTHLTNLCINQGVFPNLLKKSIVTPVHKCGDKSDPNNYRPISVLPAISKIIERIINSRLSVYLEKFNILSSSQFGFRKGKCTEDAILDLTTLVSKHLDHGTKCLTVFLDLKKAFDTVSVPILVEKMEKIGIRGTPLSLLSNYLHDRTQRVKINDHVSYDTKIEYGVPQGSVLGPTLFLIYLNDLTQLNLENGDIFSYADDTAIVFSGMTWDSVFKTAENGLFIVASWLKSALLTLNIAKTNYMCFTITKRTMPTSLRKLQIHYCDYPNVENCECAEIENVETARYLGVILDHHLTWHPHIDHVNNRIRKLVWIFKKLRHVTSQKLIHNIYLVLAQSVSVYCISIWGGATKTKMLEVERAQRCLIKTILFKPYRFATDELYKIFDVLSIRKLYILTTVLKVHVKLPFEPRLVIGRRQDRVATIPTCKTIFAKRQFYVQAALLYNKLHKLNNIYKLNSYECKKIVTKALKILGYIETEDLLARIVL